FRPVRYAREVGAATGTSEVDVLKVMSDYALRDVTLAGYLGQVDHNLAAYSLIPTTFVDHLEPEDGRSVPGIGWAWAVKIGTWLSYYPLLLLAAASLLTFARRSLEARLLDVAVKLSIGALLVQPFVHISGGRYWTTAAPFFGIAAATFLRERRIRTGQDAAPAAGVLTATDTIVVTWLGRVQVLLRAATVAVAVVLAAGLVLAAALLL
ncbi:MAG: hypothetical protein L0H31_03375, partial [Nocardioidaceae bacterium]|nr:hypothetical protein [Nocardioidaceae bacterium]